MAAFYKALTKTLGAEGVYSNDPEDPGGETICGIARKMHPEWEGWPVVDHLTAQAGAWPPEAIVTEPTVRDLVRKFYKENFWDQIDGDQIPDQLVAECVFDAAVNLSPATAGQLLQRAVNMLNVNQKRYPDIEVDGNVGPGTMAAIAQLATFEPLTTLAWMFCKFRDRLYLDKAEAHPEKEKYIKGWLKRDDNNLIDG